MLMKQLAKVSLLTPLIHCLKIGRGWPIQKQVERIEQFLTIR